MIDGLQQVGDEQQGPEHSGHGQQNDQVRPRPVPVAQHAQREQGIGSLALPHDEGAEQHAGEDEGHDDIGAAPSAGAALPAIFASPTIKSFGHLSAGRTPLSRTSAARAASATHATTSWSWSGARSGRSRIEHSNDAPGGDSHWRSSRPRPALWKSATATRPSGAPSSGPLGQPGVRGVDHVEVLDTPDD